MWAEVIYASIKKQSQFFSLSVRSDQLGRVKESRGDEQEAGVGEHQRHCKGIYECGLWVDILTYLHIVFVQRSLQPYQQPTVACMHLDEDI